MSAEQHPTSSPARTAVETSTAPPRVLVVTAVEREGRGRFARADAAGPAGQSTAKAAADADAVADTGWPVRSITLDTMMTVDLLVAGIGRANAAGATAAAIARAGATGHGYAAVVNAGIAGSLPPPTKDAAGVVHVRPAIGDVVLATASVFFEEGIDLPEGPADMNALGFELGVAPWADGNRMQTSETLSGRMADAIAAAFPGQALHRGVIATVARCSGTDRWAHEVVQGTGGAIAEAMEGAAVALVAGRFGLPFVELRVISNTCGNRPEQQWDIRRAFALLDGVLPVALRGLAGALGPNR